MALKDTIHQMQQLLDALSYDLKKAVKGNRAASQRVRTASIKFTKIAKLFRKESVEAERGPRKVKKGSKKRALSLRDC